MLRYFDKANMFELMIVPQLALLFFFKCLYNLRCTWMSKGIMILYVSWIIVCFLCVCLLIFCRLDNKGKLTSSASG